MIEVIAATGSTNADLVKRVQSGEQVAEGAWLVADRQVAGRGRQGRVWSDGAGNFMGSTLVRLRGGDPGAQTLSLVAGVTVFDAVKAIAPGLSGLALKWPNDLFVDRAKLAGILLERTGSSVIVGIGVNLLRVPDISDRLVTSLGHQGYVVERDKFATILETLWTAAMVRWHRGEWGQLREAWIAKAHPFGTPLTVHGADGDRLSGRFAGLDNDGALHLQLGDGTKRTIHAGEVDLDDRR